MAAVFSTFLRGLVGIAASVLLVAVVWTLYVQRDAVGRVTAPLVDLMLPGSTTADATPDAAPAPAGGGAVAETSPAAAGAAPPVST